jgi:hypothetical protein
VNLPILLEVEQILLRKNTLLAERGGGETTHKISNDVKKQVEFLICPSCFWCASGLSSHMAAAKDSASLARCPSCIEGNIESIPVAENEEYKFDYDIKRGVTMEFFRLSSDK